MVHEWTLAETVLEYIDGFTGERGLEIIEEFCSGRGVEFLGIITYDPMFEKRLGGLNIVRQTIIWSSIDRIVGEIPVRYEYLEV
jgi:hypothetical protein